MRHLRAGCCVVCIGAFVLAHWTAAHAFAQPAADASRAVVLVTRFADGRTTHSVITQSPRSSWTPAPYFPKVAAGRPQPGEPDVSALKFISKLGDDGAVTIEVSVLRGTSREREDHVTIVRVTPTEAVTVDALRDVGVMPVTLSLTNLAATQLHQPQVVNKTAGLEVTNVVLITEAAKPHYRITVKNVSSQAAMNFRVVTYQGGRRSLMGNRGNIDATPIIAPQESHTFTWDASSGARPSSDGWAPVPHDLIEISAVLWADGSIEGDHDPMASALMVYIGREALLERGLALLHQAAKREARTARAWLIEQVDLLSIEPDTVTQSRALQRLQHVEIASKAHIVPTVRDSMAHMRRRMQSDVARAPADPAAFEPWLTAITRRYNEWRERLRGR